MINISNSKCCCLVKYLVDKLATDRRRDTVYNAEKAHKNQNIINLLRSVSLRFKKSQNKKVNIK